MNILGNKQDIIKYLNARMTGIGIKEANQYFNLIEVSHIIFYNFFLKKGKYSKYSNILRNFYRNE